MSAIHDKNTAGLQLFPTDHCLLKELRDQLLQLNNDEMSRTLVVLPTQRLATYLLTMMAQKRSSFFLLKFIP
ncbi:MAG: hypothetical protein R3B45_17710 [Bdellovibrionota bacterium]